MRVTLFKDLSAKSRDERDLSFDELVRLVAGTKAADKRDLPLLKLGVFGDSRNPASSSLRRDENFLRVTGVECDYDGEKIPFEKAIASARQHNLQAVLYTTPSHTPATPRWRALLPTSVELDPSARHALADRANTIFGGQLARETWVLSQAFYFGAVTEHFQLVPVVGEPIDTLDLVAGTQFEDSRTEPKPRRRAANAGEARLFDDLPRKIKVAIRSGDPVKFGQPSRSELVYMVTTGLVRAGWEDAAIADLLIDPKYAISAHCLDQRRPKEYALRQASQAREAVQTDWRRDSRGNVLANDEHNVHRALDELGIQLSWNQFTDRGYVNGSGPLRKLDDHEVNELRLSVHRDYEILPTKEFFYDLMDHFTHENPFHPIIDYLDSLEWDGTERIGHVDTCPSWLTTFGGAEDTPYTRAVGRLILVAAVRRLREPGCKFDEMLVLVDPNQGTEKSSVLAMLARREEWFTDSMPLGAKDKEVIEQLAGKWIVENSELNGIRHSQVEEIKGFLSRQVDRARLAYGRLTTEAPRQCVFFGTTNSDNFLRDLQNRRFWPVQVTKFDLKSMGLQVDQMWAEASAAELAGESIRLDESLWGLAAEVQARHRQEEPWATVIRDVVKAMPGKISSSDIWLIIGKPAGMRLQHDNQRIGEAMRELGFARKRTRIYGQLGWCYVRPDPEGYEPQIYVLADQLNPGKVFASYTLDGSDGGYTPDSDDVIPQDQDDSLPPDF